MRTIQNWLVCEESGRWSAAFRTAFAQRSKVPSVPRLYEVRTLGELLAHLNEHATDLALIEVGSANLSDVLQLVLRSGPRSARYVALTDDATNRSHPATAKHGEPDTPRVPEILWEAGAVEVVSSPRQLSGLLAVHDRMATARGPATADAASRQSFADWAWSTLPWQDA